MLPVLKINAKIRPNIFKNIRTRLNVISIHATDEGIRFNVAILKINAKISLNVFKSWKNTGQEYINQSTGAYPESMLITSRPSGLWAILIQQKYNFKPREMMRRSGLLCHIKIQIRTLIDGCTFILKKESFDRQKNQWKHFIRK